MPYNQHTQFNQYTRCQRESLPVLLLMAFELQSNCIYLILIGFKQSRPLCVMICKYIGNRLIESYINNVHILRLFLEIWCLKWCVNFETMHHRV